MKIQLASATPYDFAQSVQDYGWIGLAPCLWLENGQMLRRVERLTSGNVILIHIAPGGEERGSGLETALLEAQLDAGEPLTATEEEEIIAKLRWMLRLDEDLSSFYERAQASDGLWTEVRTGRGRLLRSPTLFEDVVKTICTTNTTWRQTKGMVQRLVDYLGSSYPQDPDLKAFPAPEQIEAAGIEFLQKEIRLGYRSAYVHQLAQEVVSGERDLTRLKESDLPTPELKKELLTIKGVGEYAANTLLMALGRYGELALDSEMRAFVKEKYFDGQQVTDAEILAVYDEWDQWRYLAYWFDAGA